MIIAGILGAMVSGGVYAFWSGFKANAAPPAALATPRQPNPEYRGSLSVSLLIALKRVHLRGCPSSEELRNCSQKLRCGERLCY